MVRNLVHPQAPEAVTTQVRDNGDVSTAVLVDPTQVRRPWRSTVRTLFQAVVALATLLPFVAAEIYSNAADYPAVVAQVLTVAGGLARVMAHPKVEQFLRTFLPFLAAAPKVGPADHV